MDRDGARRIEEGRLFDPAVERIEQKLIDPVETSSDVLPAPTHRMLNVADHSIQLDRFVELWNLNPNGDGIADAKAMSRLDLEADAARGDVPTERNAAPRHFDVESGNFDSRRMPKLLGRQHASSLGDAARFEKKCGPC